MQMQINPRICMGDAGRLRLERIRTSDHEIGKFAAPDFAQILGTSSIHDLSGGPHRLGIRRNEADLQIVQNMN